MTTSNKPKLVSFLLKAACAFVLVQCCFSAPVDTPYSSFVAEMTRKNCSLPSQIPSLFGAKATTIDASIQVCNSPDYFKFNPEVSYLCKEIFGLLKNISCSPQNAALPKIQVSLSDEVCTDFAFHKAELPEGLLRHLSDSFDCKLMCSEDLEPPCKVLLWSFLVQNQLKIPRLQEITKIAESSSTTEIKPTSKLQTIPLNTSNETSPEKIDLGNKIKEQDLVDIKKPKKELHSKLIITTKENDAPKMLEIAGNSDAATTLKESKKLNITKPDVDATALTFHTSDIIKPKVESQNAKPELESMSKVADLSPVGKNLSSSIESIGETNLNNKFQAVGERNDPEDHLTPANEANIKSQSNLLKEHVLESLNEIGEDLKKNAKEHKNIPENTVLDSYMEPKNIIHEQSTNAALIFEIDQKPETPEKVDDSAAFLASSSPSNEHPSNEPNEHPSNEPNEHPSNEPNEHPSVSDSAPTAVSEGTSENIPSPAPVITMAVTPSLEKMEDENPLPSDKETDQYNDLDNADGDLDGEYPKPEYGDGGIYEPTKNKESIPETPKSNYISKEPVISQNEDVKGFDGFSSKDSFGRGSDKIQVLAAFPDQEDSHFFFYFLSIVLFLMAGYLIFHNKQKIIALIVEGRHERRRRSHGLGYKKLETK